MDTQTHKILDYLEHVWPYVSGIVVTMFAAVRLWWYNNKQMQNRMFNLEVIAESHAQIIKMMKEDLKNFSEKIEKMDEKNDTAHNDIKNTMMGLFINDKK